MTTETRSGMDQFDGFNNGDPGWGDVLIANTLRHARFAWHLSVKDRDLTAPPGSPAAGDTYIPAATATGAWAGKDGQVAVWDGTAWVFGVPREGWVAWIEDEAKLCAFTSAAWSAGIALA